jgi:hypothetical protein
MKRVLTPFIRTANIDPHPTPKKFFKPFSFAKVMQGFIHNNQTVIHFHWWYIHKLKKFSLICGSLFTPVVNKDLGLDRWPDTRITRMAFPAI